MKREERTDARWEYVRPLLPPQQAWTGRPAKDHRLVRNGILWIDRAASRVRNRVERLINRCERCRRRATRDEQRAEHDRAMWVIAAIMLWR